MTFRKLFLLAPVALITACGSKAACEDYIAAAEACYNDASDSGVTVSGLDASVCESDAAQEVDASVYNCYTEAYEGGDCGTTDGILAIATALADCDAA